MPDTLLQDFLSGAAAVGETPIVIFDRPLSRDELLAVDDLMTVGEGLA